jgi:hypothetical protein
MVLANQLDSGGYVDIDNLKKYYFFISASNHLIEKKYSKKVRKATNGLTRYQEKKLNKWRQKDEKE